MTFELGHLFFAALMTVPLHLAVHGIDLGMSAFTERDRECLESPLGEGVDAVTQSFVGRAADIPRPRPSSCRRWCTPTSRTPPSSHFALATR